MSKIITKFVHPTSRSAAGHSPHCSFAARCSAHVLIFMSLRSPHASACFSRTGRIGFRDLSRLASLVLCAVRLWSRITKRLPSRARSHAHRSEAACALHLQRLGSAPQLAAQRRFDSSTQLCLSWPCSAHTSTLLAASAPPILWMSSSLRTGTAHTRTHDAPSSLSIPSHASAQQGAALCGSWSLTL